MCPLCAVSYYSLFPLLIDAKEYPIKVMLLVAYTMAIGLSFSDYFSGRGGATETGDNSKQQSGEKYNKAPREHPSLLGKSATAFLLGLVAVECYNQLVHHLLFTDALPFVPLMLVSVYCSLGLFWFWVEQLYQMLD